MKSKFENRDCMDGMKEYSDNHFDLAIVDPEYGGGNDAIDVKDHKNLSKHEANRTQYKVFKNIAPEPEYFKLLMRISKNQIIWGVNFYKNIDLSGGRICWDKKGTVFGRAELAYYSGSKSVNVFEYTWNGMIQENMKNKESRIHPTQKPIALYIWLLNTYAKLGDLILDTHVGSASSLIACEKMDFDYVGYEIDIDYYNDAMQRISEFRMQTDLFKN